MSERNRVIYAAVRDAHSGDGEYELHIECRFENGEKYAPIKVDAMHADLADQIAQMLNDAALRGER